MPPDGFQNFIVKETAIVWQAESSVLCQGGVDRDLFRQQCAAGMEGQGQVG